MKSLVNLAWALSLAMVRKKYGLLPSSVRPGVVAEGDMLTILASVYKLSLIHILLKLNTGVRHVLGLIAVSGVQNKK